jgi:hypothetical protein
MRLGGVVGVRQASPRLSGVCVQGVHVQRLDTSNREKRARDNGVLVVLLAAIVAAYGITAFGIYELVKAVA